MWASLFILIAFCAESTLIATEKQHTGKLLSDALNVRCPSVRKTAAIQP
jgi:N12 class adenine-specific DNA methylase